MRRSNSTYPLLNYFGRAVVTSLVSPVKISTRSITSQTNATSTLNPLFWVKLLGVTAVASAIGGGVLFNWLSTIPDFPNLLLKLQEQRCLHSSLISNIYVNSLGANERNEDTFSLHTLRPQQHLFGVFDGHGGSFSSKYASRELPAALASRLDQIDQIAENIEGWSSDIADEMTTQALIHAFMETDSKIILTTTLSALLSRNATADLLAGTCASVAFVCERRKKLWVGNVGDCRAVLIRKEEAGGWRIVRLTQDHNTDNPNEVERIKGEHPNEPHLFVGDRLKGILKPTRALGGSFLKSRLSKMLVGKLGRDKIWDAPYTTASPQVVVRDIEEEDAFLVLASDGLWDMCGDAEFLSVFSEALEEESHVSSHVIKHVLRKVVTHMTFDGELEEREKLDQLVGKDGSFRRRFYDDITLVVVELNGGKKDGDDKDRDGPLSPGGNKSPRNRGKESPRNSPKRRVSRLESPVAFGREAIAALVDMIPTHRREDLIGGELKEFWDGAEEDLWGEERLELEAWLKQKYGLQRKESTNS